MVELQPLGEEDLSRLVEWIDSPVQLVLWGGPRFSYPLDVDQLRKHLEESKKTDSDQILFKACLSRLDQPIGHIELGRIDRGRKTGSICRVLIDPNYRSQGLGSQMLDRILEFAFRDLKLEWINLNVYHLNQSAIALYKRKGFILYE